MATSFLPVFLNNGRDYVQGIQLVAYGVDLLLRETQVADGFIAGVEFRKITDRQVFAEVSDNQPDDIDGFLGKVVVCVQSTDVPISINLFEGKEKAELKILEPSAKLDRVLSEDYPKQSGVFLFHSATNLYELLGCIVQAIKKLHEEIDPSVYDVWFTGMRNSNIPLAVGIEKGQIEVNHIRNVGSAPQFQSLQMISVFDSNDKKILSNVVSFAFKKGL